MFLDATYFKGELYLPGLKTSEGACGYARMLQSIGENTLEWFILKYEWEFLALLLGRTLAKNFIKGMQADDINPIWTDLMNAIYQKDNQFSFSPAANYVYYWITRTGRTQTTTNGEVKGTSDYSVIASDADKLVKAWNDMLPMIHYIREWVADNWNIYGPYAGKGCVHHFELINAYNI